MAALVVTLSACDTSAPPPTAPSPPTRSVQGIAALTAAPQPTTAPTAAPVPTRIPAAKHV
ncbi:MAG: hypothetical protein KJ734_05795 [Chloroflexi bacterium]|nr:hypothetical protein [Chloroflexota bacterium]